MLLQKKRIGTGNAKQTRTEIHFVTTDHNLKLNSSVTSFSYLEIQDKHTTNILQKIIQVYDLRSNLSPLKYFLERENANDFQNRIYRTLEIKVSKKQIPYL